MLARTNNKRSQRTPTKHNALRAILPLTFVAGALTLTACGSQTSSTHTAHSAQANAAQTDPLACGNNTAAPLSWTSAGPLISPKEGDFAVKDPTVVYYNNQYHIFATINDGNWKSMQITLDNLDAQATTNYQPFSPGNTGSSAVAPQVFYFTPQKTWYMFTQWPASYTTNQNIEDVNGWIPRVTLPEGSKGAYKGNSLDFWVICNDADCYMYYFKDDGKMYYMSTPVDNFPNFDPGTFKVADIEDSGPTNIVFEAGNIYKIKNSDYYLLQVEGWGETESRRLYRSWLSTSLDGPWIAHHTDESAPFAGPENTTFNGPAWSHQISHGEMIRDGYDEKMVLDPCNMQMLYQGVDLNGFNGNYGERPYHIGVLKQK